MRPVSLICFCAFKVLLAQVVKSIAQRKVSRHGRYFVSRWKPRLPDELKETMDELKLDCRRKRHEKVWIISRVLY